MEANLGLFDNGNEANLSSTVSMVEDVLVELGHFLNECRVDADDSRHAWRVVKGSAFIQISLLVDEGDPQAYARLRIVAPVMTCDARVDLNKLYRRLLNINLAGLRGCAFATRQSEVLIVAERSTLDLDRSEVLDLIQTVQNYADDWDNRLVDEFGGRLGGIG